MEDAELLNELVITRIAVSNTYSKNITELCDAHVPMIVVDKLRAERDEILAELTKRIDALRHKIAN